MTVAKKATTTKRTTRRRKRQRQTKTKLMPMRRLRLRQRQRAQRRQQLLPTQTRRIKMDRIASQTQTTTKRADTSGVRKETTGTSTTQKIKQPMKLESRQCRM